MERGPRGTANKEKAHGMREKQRRNLKLQVCFYDEERDEAEWAEYQHIFSPAPPPPAQSAPPAATGLVAPPPPPPPVAEEAPAPVAEEAPAPVAAEAGALQQGALPPAPGQE